MTNNKGSAHPIHDKTISNSSQISYESIKAAGEDFIAFLRKTGQIQWENNLIF